MQIPWIPFIAAVTVLASGPLRAIDEDSKPSLRRPDRFAIIFNMGYGTDALPRDPASFAKLLQAIRKAHFNVVLAKYDDWRAEICRKLDVKILVDLLVEEHHVYKNPDGARALCEKLRGNEVIYGYHLWSDNIGGTYPGRSRDVKNVNEWDATHPVYVGSYRMSRVSRVESLDLLGYYDFHWTRGGHWSHLAKASRVATARDAYFLRYCDPAAGRIGKGNPNRVGFTIATSIPFGLKGYMFHYGGGVIDSSGRGLDALGNDLRSVNAKFVSVGEELMAIGNPVAVYSTPVTRTAKDRAIDAEPAIPGGLAAVPEDLWFTISQGEVVLGLFKDARERDVVALASHNAYQPQPVVLEFVERVKRVEFFDRQRRRWTGARRSGNKALVSVDVFAVELVRIER